ncbi:hypothetical protein L218DRAFT_998805 [Marasmius fiardii PR-910]|nr:hypothetical protein L218DRAFT_998805 [Marasmius fiardii PR-910]
MPGNDLDEEELEQIRRYEDFTTVDWIEDSIYERNRRIRNSRTLVEDNPFKRHWSLRALRQRSTEGVQSWFIVSLVGICIGINAALIAIVTEWLSDIKMGYCSDGWWLNQQFCCWEIEKEETEACDSWHPWSTVTPARYAIYVLFATLFSFIASHLVKSLAKYAAGSGISEIKCILAGFTMKGFLGFATFCIKSMTLPLVIASGLSVGKEGPSVHLACCVGSLVAGLFKKFARSQGKMREIITAASAAGVAVAFGSPVGGVLFSIEEMSSNFSIKTMYRSFFCALVATFTLSAMNPFRTGKLVLFQVTYDRDWHFFEILFFVVLGIFGGLYGAFVVKFHVQVSKFRRKHLANHGVAEAVVLATLTAVIGYFNRFLRIDMTESMAVLFRECEGVGGDICDTSSQWRIVNSLFLATIVRVSLVVVSYGVKVPAGIFVPSMAIGASFGRMIGVIVKAMYRAYPESGIFQWCKPDVPCITPGTYAFLGAAAALSGVMRITVTVVVIMFELTGALGYVLPTMIVLLVTKAVGDMLGVTGIADEMIRFNGFPFLEKEDEDHGRLLSFALPCVSGSTPFKVSSVMRTSMQTIPEKGLKVSDVEALMRDTDIRCFPIVDADEGKTLVGYIGRTEVSYVIRKYRVFVSSTISTLSVLMNGQTTEIERTKDLNPGTLCIFSPSNRVEEEHGNLVSGVPIGDEDEDDGEPREEERRPLRRSEDAIFDIGNEEEEGEGEATPMPSKTGDRESQREGRQGNERERTLNFWPWVNGTPITVSPEMKLEVVMELFKRLGPRVILVESQGFLVGLVTVKDVLRFIATEKHRSPQTDGWEERGGLDSVLEEIWVWMEGCWQGLVVWGRGLVGRGRWRGR